MHGSSTCSAARRLAWAAVAAFLAASVAAQHPARLPEGAGLDVDLAGAAAALSLVPVPADEAAGPSTVLLRVRIPWVSIEPVTGLRDWGRLERLLAAAEDRRTPLVLTLTGPGPEGVGVPVEEGVALERWLGFVAGVAERGRGRVAAYSTWERPNDAASWGRPPSVREHAFLLKRTALTLRAIDPEAAVAQGSLVPSLTFQEDLFDEGIGPFVDAVGVDAAGGGAAMVAAGDLAALVAERDPAAAVWMTGVEAQGGSALALWEEAVAARAQPVSLVTFRAEPLRGSTALPRVLDALARAFPAGTAPAVAGADRLMAFPRAAGARWARHVVAGDLSCRVAYLSQPDDEGRGTVDVRVRSTEVSGFRIIDPTGEHDGPITHVIPNLEAGHVTVRLPAPDRTLVLAFERALPPPELREAVDVAGREVLSVEEILARHLAAQAVRDRHLAHYEADLTTEMAYELGSSGRRVTVRVESRYFHDQDGPKEVENLRFFVNGAPYEPKRGVPEIPLLQPDKVTVRPLDVHLDRRYAYRLEGEEQVDGRRAWRVAFEPLEAGLNRHAGTVWIDALTHDRLRTATVQVGLEPPLLSNAQEDEFVRVSDASGREHVVVGRSSIERVVSVLGASVVVRMRLTFSGFEVNAPDFAEAREAALASDHQVLRDTDEGFRYLSRQPDGTRVLSKGTSRKMLAVAGFRVDPAFGGVLPLGGVNWLDNDFRGKGLQLNFFLAGAINTFSVADPSLRGSRVDGSFDAFVPVVSRRDRLRLPGAAVDRSQDVKVREPSLTFGLGFPLGRHGRLGVDLDLAHQTWTDTDDTAPTFVEPSDGFVTTGRLRGEYHRAAWDLRAWVERSVRSDWELWGPDGGLEGPSFFQADADRYWRWGARVAGSWFVGPLQRLSISAEYRGGSSLDRFSQYEFAAFGGPEAAGFAGSGIHFDESVQLRAGYGFDVAGRAGVEAYVDYALIRDRLLPEALETRFGEWGDVLGIGVSGTVPGPWGTLVQFEAGVALHAEDHDGVAGDATFQVVFLKLIR